MKHIRTTYSLDIQFVALLVSAWIETYSKHMKPSHTFVALLVSAWIETACIFVAVIVMGRTPRECVD